MFTAKVHIALLTTPLPAMRTCEPSFFIFYIFYIYLIRMSLAPLFSLIIASPLYRECE
jgi:hypothetical protein